MSSTQKCLASESSATPKLTVQIPGQAPAQHPQHQPYRLQPNAGYYRQDHAATYMQHNTSQTSDAFDRTQHATSHAPYATTHAQYEYGHHGELWLVGKKMEEMTDAEMAAYGYSGRKDEEEMGYGWGQ